MVTTISSKPKEHYMIEQKMEKVQGITTAKDFRGWVQGRINKYSRSANLEFETLFRGILNAYNHFHPETTAKIEVPRWHGKSSFEVIEGVDNYLIIKYQKPEKGAEPQEVRTEVTKREMNNLKQAIKDLWKGEALTSEEVARQYFRLMEWTWVDWNESVFTKRRFHNKFTLQLGALDRLEQIKYSRGKIILK